MSRHPKSEARPAPEPSTALVRMELDPQALIQKAVENGANIEVLERLVALAKDVRQAQAREAWHRAMAEFQRTCPAIVKSGEAKIATRSGGNYSYTYAPLAEIMRTIVPVMGPLGLSVSYRVRHDKDSVIAVCVISHEMGHQEASGEVAMPVVQGDGTGANAAQRVGIASTYAKRYALLAVIGLAPEDDPDAQDGADATGVKMPQRASEKRAEPAPAPPPTQQANVWTGKIAEVVTKTGKSPDGPWTLYIVKTEDNKEFGTFSATEAKFAKDAGSSPVRITWEKTAKGSQRILSIEPEEKAGA